MLSGQFISDANILARSCFGDFTTFQANVVKAKVFRANLSKNVSQANALLGNTPVADECPKT
jgi:hypothetical protein